MSFSGPPLRFDVRAQCSCWLAPTSNRVDRLIRLSNPQARRPAAAQSITTCESARVMSALPPPGGPPITRTAAGSPAAAVAAAAALTAGGSRSNLSLADQRLLAHTTLQSLKLQLIPALIAAGSVRAVVSAAARSGLLSLQSSVDRSLPSAKWFTIPISFDLNEVRVESFSLQHGAHLHPLSVRVLHDHVLPSTAEAAHQLDSALVWLRESLMTNCGYPVIGLDAESDCKPGSDFEIRLLQLSTGTRALLIRIPPASTIQQWMRDQHAAGKPRELLTPAFHALMTDKTIFKAGADVWTDALGQNRRGEQRRQAGGESKSR